MRIPAKLATRQWGSHGVQPTAASRPQRRRSCFGSRNAIFSMMLEHLNAGWRTTVVDVPAATGALSTPTPTPSPLTISPLSRQASTQHAAAAQTDRVGAGADPIGRLEEELIQLGDVSGQVGEALQVGEQQEARR